MHFSLYCRDLKPENILVYVFHCSPEEETDWERILISSRKMLIKISDFGLCRHLIAQEASKQAQTVVGTPQYMAPEVKSGRFGVESDIWSIGVIMYELATKELPDFDGKYLLQTATINDTLDFYCCFIQY